MSGSRKVKNLHVCFAGSRHTGKKILRPACETAMRWVVMQLSVGGTDGGDMIVKFGS